MSDIRMGSVIANRYRLEALIGEGGMATVWQGTDLSLSRTVAVKVLRPEVALQADAVARFRREAHAAAKLNHPNVVQIFDTGVDGQTHFIVMEYLPEPDLKRIIRDWAPLPEAKVVDVAVQCCRALSYAHRNGIVHRDVKPHNILFTDDGRAKLSDFGIAAAVGTGATGPGGTVLGSAHYMSPEQIQGSPAGPHSDIYSLGCVLYEALTGKTLFTGESESEIAAKHLRERPVPLRSLNPGLGPGAEFIVNKAMAREVAQRYRTADEMLADLTKLTAGEELDRTGVLAAPEGATMAIQPPAAQTPPPSVPGPTQAQTVISPPRPEPASTPPPVLRPAERAPERPGWTAAGAVVIAILAIVVVGWLAKVAFYPGKSGKDVQVPMVKGMTVEQARGALEGAELILGDIKYVEAPAQPEGKIVEQTPAEGQTVPGGSKVDLVVNRGKELVAAIAVEGMTLQEANEALERAGLSVGDVQQVFHATVPANQVIKQSIRPTTKLERGTGIDLVVSKGPEPAAPANTAANTVAPEAPDPDPEVTLIQDTNYDSPDPSQRRFRVTVTVQGQRSGQTIQVIKQDDTGGRVAVLSAKLSPNQSREVPVVTQGAATIEVVHNGKTVFHEDLPTPDADVPPTDGSE
jgi:eukaryotic-like serine/threonine-protein kinase